MTDPNKTTTTLLLIRPTVLALNFASTLLAMTYGRIRTGIEAVLCTMLIMVIFITSSLAASRPVMVNPRITGSTVYESGHLLSFAYQHIKIADGQVTPRRLADAIELVYREDGYFLAEVEIRPSRHGKSITFDIHEGQIGKVSIEGVDKQLFERIMGYVEPIVGKTALQQSDFERVVALINDLAGVHVSTEIDYPDNSSGARLRIIGKSQKFGPGSITIDNPPHELGEAASVFINQEFYSTFVAGDLLRLQGAATLFDDQSGNGFSANSFATYRAPIGNYGAYFEGYLGNVYARRDATGGFVDTDIEGLNAGIAIGVPILRDLNRYSYSILEFRHSEGETSSTGSSVRSSVSVVSSTFLYGHNFDSGHALELGLNMTTGWREGSSPTTTNDGDDNFWHLRMGAGIAGPLDNISPNLAWRFEVLGQYTNNRLPAVEEYYLGNRNSLRGYKFGEAEGDIGVSGIFELSKAFYPNHEYLQSVTPYGFMDFGYVRNNNPSLVETNEERLLSAGIGLRAYITSNVSVNTWIGLPLIDGPVTKSGNPDIYVSLTISW